MPLPRPQFQLKQDAAESVVGVADDLPSCWIEIPKVPTVQCIPPVEEGLGLLLGSVGEPQPAETSRLLLVLVNNDLLQRVEESSTRPRSSAVAAVGAAFNVRPKRSQSRKGLFSVTADNLTTTGEPGTLKGTNPAVTATSPLLGVNTRNARLFDLSQSDM